jgi:hypothetical protein
VMAASGAMPVVHAPQPRPALPSFAMPAYTREDEVDDGGGIELSSVASWPQPAPPPAIPRVPTVVNGEVIPLAPGERIDPLTGQPVRLAKAIYDEL